MELSVVIGCIEASRTIDACLASLRETCTGVDAELIVVDASRDDTATRASASSGAPPVRVIRSPLGTLTPALWATGAAEARGDLVAFTIGQCVADRGWATAMLAALRAPRVVGAGGPIALDPSATAADAAVYFLRYSAVMPERVGAESHPPEPAGDNAVYRRDDLVRHASSLRDGFWELDFHRRVRAEGGELVFEPSAVMRFAGGSPLGTIARHRFAHGRHSGASRVAAGARRRWQVIAAAPLVPLVLLNRIAKRTGRAQRGSLLRSIPAFAVLASSWAAGEAWGAISGSGLSNRGTQVLAA